jgi:hypothetical protein
MDEDYENEDLDYEEDYNDLDVLDTLDEVDEAEPEIQEFEVLDDSEEEIEEDLDDIDAENKEELDEIKDLISKQTALKSAGQTKTKKMPQSVKISIVPKNECRTSDVLYSNEMALVLAHRAEQIAASGVYYSKDSFNKPERIAYEEIIKRECPLKIRRVVGCYKNEIIYCEVFKVNQMILPNIGTSKDLGFD